MEVAKMSRKYTQPLIDALGIVDRQALAALGAHHARRNRLPDNIVDEIESISIRAASLMQKLINLRQEGNAL